MSSYDELVNTYPTADPSYITVPSGVDTSFGTPYYIDPSSVNVADQSANHVYTGAVYAIQAVGGYHASETFANITALSEQQVQTFDVTGALEVNYDVRIFNDMIGILKDASNINVWENSYYDSSSDSFSVDQISLSAPKFIYGLFNDSNNITSVGKFSTLYSDFAQYVTNYFGLGNAAQANAGSLLTGYSTLFSSDYGFNPNGGVFDSKAFMKLLTAQKEDADGNYINDLCGSIAISNITKLLRFVVDNNIMGNRDVSMGTTASNPKDRHDYGVSDGFFENDLIFIPQDGFQIVMKLVIETEAYLTPLNNKTPFSVHNAIPNTDASMTFDLSSNPSNDPNMLYQNNNVSATSATINSVNASNTTYSAFAQTTTPTQTLITRTVSAPLLLRLKNQSITAIKLLSGQTTTNSVSFDVSGVYTKWDVCCNKIVGDSSVNIIDVSNTSSSFMDASYILPNKMYTYSVIPYGANTIPGIPQSVNLISLPKIDSVQVVNEKETSITLSVTGGFTGFDVSRNGAYLTTVDSGGDYNTNFQWVDTSNINPSTTYTYNLTPIGMSGEFWNPAGNGTIVTRHKGAETPSLSTYSYNIGITDAHTTSVTKDSIALTYTGIYSTANLYYDGSAIYSSVSTHDKLPYTDTGFTNSNLASNQTYLYNIVPSDKYDNCFNFSPFEYDISSTTLGIVTSASTTSITSTTADLSYNGIFTDVTIHESVNAIDIATNVTNKSYHVPSLSPNTQYNYTIIPYNSDGVVNNTDVSNIPVVTLGQVTSASVSDFTSHGMSLVYNGQYSKVNIKNNTTNHFDASNVTGTGPTDISNLSPNTSYTFTLYPINSADVISTNNSDIKTTTAKYTLGQITTGNTVPTSSSVRLNFDGSYNSANIYYADGSSNTTAKTYLLSSLTPNTYYEYTVKPVNGNTIESSMVGDYIDLSATTLGKMKGTSVTSFTSSSVDLSFNGSYQSVNIYKNNTFETNTTSNTFSETNLDPNTYYKYTLKPKNIDDVESSTVGDFFDISATTLGKMTAANIDTIASDSMSLSFDGSYSTVDIQNNTTNNFDASNVTGTTSTISSLLPNTAYSFTIYPTNSANVSSDAAGDIVSTSSMCTYGKVTSGAVTAITSSTVDLSFNGSYQFVNVYNNDAWVSDAMDRLTDVNLSPNTYIMYTVKPVNNDGTESTDVSDFVDVSATTLGQVTSIGTPNVTSSDASFSFDGTYSAVNIYATDGASDNRSYTNINGTSYDITGLNPNVGYTLTVKPLNSDSIESSNTGDIQSTTITTNGTVYSVTASNIDQYSVHLDVSGVYFTCDIASSDMSVTSGIAPGDTSCDISGLTPDTSYTLYVTPNNSVGVAGTGTDVGSVTFSTLSE
jgi:hypothetical protein